MTSTPPGVHEGPADFRFDFDQFERMFELGILHDLGPKLELLEGRIVEMAPGSDAHSKASADLVYLLAAGLRSADLKAEFGVRADGTLRIGDHSAPAPDVFVVRPFSGRKYAQASDVVLLVEVSISTRAEDLKIKMPMYARAGIPEAWMVEPEARSIRVFRQPRADGSWGHEAVVSEGAVAPLFSDRIRIELSDLF